MRQQASRFAVVVAVMALVCGAAAAADNGRQGLIIRQTSGSLEAAVQQLGGRITQRYRNVDAIAAEVPKDQLAAVLGLVGDPARISKDLTFALPRPIVAPGSDKAKSLASPELRADGVQVLSGQALSQALAALPADYSFNNVLVGATAVHNQGITGTGVIVATIDTGIANVPGVPALAGSVIGGETFVPDDAVVSPTSHLNDPHGTEVGTVIAGHALFLFSSDSVFVRSLQQHAPDSVIACQTPPLNLACPANASAVPLIGTAPSASLYALKVFDSLGNGAPESVIIAAMDRAITLRRNFNHGVASAPVGGTGAEDDPFRFDSLNIRVVNMSLGGPTLFAGRDLEDDLTRQMLAEGITIVAASGNDGFAAMTGSSPGSGFGALTVGAASTPTHERILRDVQFGLGFGVLFRPFDQIQTAFFSGRGPTADGRLDPDVTANGFGTLAQGADGVLFLVAGTSFSSPTAAGVAALLREGVPTASATQVRNAIVQTADGTRLGDGSGPIDQGKGLINAAAALDLLRTRNVSERLPVGLGTHSVTVNVGSVGFFPVVFRANKFRTQVKNLLPGQAAQLFVPSQDRTDRFLVTVKNLRPELPPEQQNVLFGDDVLVDILDAPTSFGSFRTDRIIVGDTTFTVDNPQEGLVRVAVLGDFSNAGRISADVEIERVKNPLPPPTEVGRVSQGELVPIDLTMPAGVHQAVFELFWHGDWGHYPTNDLDMFLLDPAGEVNVDGATNDSPERVVIDDPAAGTWTVFVQGFTIHGDGDNDRDDREHFTLRVTADGKRLSADDGDDDPH